MLHINTQVTLFSAMYGASCWYRDAKEVDWKHISLAFCYEGAASMLCCMEFIAIVSVASNSATGAMKNSTLSFPMVF